MKARTLRILLGAFLLLTGALQAAEQPWLTDYSKALAKAKADGKVVLLDFTGSDFCSACKQLKAEVFPKKEFQEYAARRLVLVEVDFPLNKKLSEAQTAANTELKERFKVDGFPTLLVVDASGKKLGEVDFDNDAAGLVKAIEQIASKAP